MKYWRRVFFMLVILMSFSQVSFAQSAAEIAREVERLSQQGVEAFHEEDYARAIEMFTAAYELEPVPNLLFNIAKCHEQLKDWDAAIENYEAFIVSPDVDPAARRNAMAQIENIRNIKELEESRRLQDAQVEEPATDPDVVSPPVATVTEYNHTLAYVLMGTGALLIGGGVTFGVLASAKERQFQETDDFQEKTELRDSGRRMAITADVLYVAGALTAGYGLFRFLTAKPVERPLQADAWFTGDGAGANVTLRF